MRGQPVVGVGGRERVQESLERLDPRLEGHERVLVAAPEQHGAAFGVDAPRELAGERGLADPGLAGDEGEAQRPRPRVRPRPLQPRQRGLAALGPLGGGQGGRQRGGAGLGRTGDPAAADVLDERPRGGRRRDPELGAQALAHGTRGGERRRAIAVEREQADQLAVRRLGQRLDVQAPARPRDRGGEVAGVLRPGGQRGQHAGQLDGVLVACAQRPVALEAGEQLTVPGVRGGLELAVGDAPPELQHVDPDRVREPDALPGHHQRVAARRPQRPAQLVERVAQRLAGAVLRHVGTQPPGERGARVRPG